MFLRICAALYGLGLAIALVPRLVQAAPPDQTPGAMTAAGVAANAPFLSLVAVIVLPIAAVLALAGPIRKLGDPTARSWAANTAAAALLAGLWMALIDQNLLWSAVPSLILFFAAVALRRRVIAFSRRDAILIPTTLSVFIALFDSIHRITFHQHLAIAVILVFAVRLALTAFRQSAGLAPALCFAAAPLGLAVLSHFNEFGHRRYGALVLLIALGTPFVLRATVPNTLRARRAVRLAVVWFVYPAVAVLYASATSLLAAEGKPHADLFETGHNLTPAGEMRRGELPYRDIIPAHGLLQDGLLDWMIMKRGPVNAGRVLTVHGEISSLNSAALYALPAALTGSADVGILVYFLGVMMRTSGGSFRVLPALIALALLVAGVRRRNPRLIGFAAAACVLAGLTSLDFGAYTAAALVAALVRVWKKEAMRAAAIGLTAAAAVVGAGFAVFRIFDDFLRVTLFELPSLTSVYTLGGFVPPASLKTRRFFPELIGSFFDADGFFYAFWFAALVALAVMITRRRSGLREGIVVLLVWVVVAALSYSERRHIYFHYVVPSVIGATMLLVMQRWRSAGRAIAAGILLLVVIAFQPTQQLVVLSMLRRASGPLSPGLTEVPSVRRAAGAFYRARDAEIIKTAHQYVSRRLAPDETFFDFTNRGALYFLLERDVPIRQVEVAFYQTEERQREVIARIAANPKVRLALVPAPDDQSVNVDGVPNQVRAPLVWEYLRKHFRPAFEQGPVVFWERID